MGFFKRMTDFAGATRSNTKDGACGFYDAATNSFRAKDNNGDPIPFSSEGTADYKIDFTILVAKNGNDATGEVGNMSKPFLTIEAATAQATGKELIIVASGLYLENDAPFTVDANYWLDKGCIVSCVGSVVETKFIGDKITIRGNGGLISSSVTPIHLNFNNAVIDVECDFIQGKFNCIKTEGFDSFLRIRAIDLIVLDQYLIRGDDGPIYDIECTNMKAINALGASLFLINVYGVDNVVRVNKISATNVYNNASGLFPAIFNGFGGTAGIFLFDFANFVYTGNQGIALLDGNGWELKGNYYSDANGVDVVNIGTTLVRLKDAYFVCAGRCLGLGSNNGYVEVQESKLVTTTSNLPAVQTPAGGFFAAGGYLDIRDTYIQNNVANVAARGIYHNGNELRLNGVKIVVNAVADSIFSPVAKNIQVETNIAVNTAINVNVTNNGGGVINTNVNVGVIPLSLNS